MFENVNCKLCHKLMYKINFWTNLTLYSVISGVLRRLVGSYLLFRMKYCLCLRLLYPEGRRTYRFWWRTACIFVSWTLKVDIISVFKMMVSVLPTARHHIPRNSGFMVTTLTTQNLFQHSLLLSFDNSVPWLNNPHMPSRQCLGPYAWSFLSILSSVDEGLFSEEHFSSALASFAPRL